MQISVDLQDVERISYNGTYIKRLKVKQPNSEVSTLVWEGASEGLEFGNSVVLVGNNYESGYGFIGIGTCTDTDIIIPKYHNRNEVKILADSALSSVSIPTIRRLIMPDSILYFGSYGCAFLYNLIYVKLSNNLLNIGDGSFTFCGITSVVIPYKVTRIGGLAFQSCQKLMNIVIPQSITTIESSAFYDCKSLKTVYYKGTESEWSQIDIRSGNTPLQNANIKYYSETEPTENASNYWRYVDGMPTVYNGRLPSNGLNYTISDDGNSYLVSGIGTCSDTYIRIPDMYNGLTVSGISGNAFQGNTTIEGVILPSYCITIGINAFANCTNLKAVTLPSGIESIEANAFANCKYTEFFFMTFNGAKALWHDIIKRSNWNGGQNFLIACVDGIITANGAELS